MIGYKNFLTETEFVDYGSKVSFGEEHTPMSPAKFLKLAKAKGSEFTKWKDNEGLNAVKFLSKNLPFPVEVLVHRPSWNYGKEGVVTVRAKGFRDIFSYSNNNGTKTPSFEIGPSLGGLKTPEYPDGVKSGYRLGSYKSIQDHNGVLQDIVDIFDAYKKKHGKEFNLTDYKKIVRQKQKIKNEFEKTQIRVDKQLDIAHGLSKKIPGDSWDRIKLGRVRFNQDNNVVRIKFDEPRIYRHPDEYGQRGEDIVNSKEYDKFQIAFDKAVDILHKFADKYNIEVDISA